MTRDTWEQCLGALCAWREASGEGHDGMRAILHVINNRHRESDKGWEDEIASHLQFSSMTTPGDRALVRWPTEANPEFDDALALASLVYSQADDDLTAGATFYYNPATATSDWFLTQVRTGMLIPTVDIGHHRFYKRKGA